jgi:hypothetical protein
MNKEIETSNERLQLFDSIQNDPAIIDYLSSDRHRRKQIKKKDSFLTEQDPTSTRLELIASYILRPDNKEWNIKTPEQFKDIGRIGCKTSKKRLRFDRVLYLEQIVAKMNRTSQDDYSMSSEEFAGNLTKMTDDSELWDFLDFSQTKHIKALFRFYHEIIPEIEHQPDTRVWSVISLMDDLIDLTKFNKVDNYIVMKVQEGGYSYNQIRKLVNQEFGTTYTYRAISEKIRFYIPNRIAKTYKRQINKIKI